MAAEEYDEDFLDPDLFEDDFDIDLDELEDLDLDEEWDDELEEDED